MNEAPDPEIRRLDDDGEYRAELATLREIAAEYDLAEARLAAFRLAQQREAARLRGDRPRGVTITPAQRTAGVIDARGVLRAGQPSAAIVEHDVLPEPVYPEGMLLTVEHAAAARLDGRPLPSRRDVQDVRDLEFLCAALGKALLLQADKLDVVKRRVEQEIIDQAQPRHQALVRTIVERFEELADLLDEERQIRAQLFHDGVGGPFGPAAWPKIDSFARAIGSRSLFESKVNALSRHAAGYIDRPWDHSRVGQYAKARRR
jgi:hypothetical protein